MTTIEIVKPEVLPEIDDPVDGPCDGCPRCNGDNPDFCTEVHERYKPYHPLCKACRHCALRGTHDENGSDLLR